MISPSGCCRSPSGSGRPRAAPQRDPGLPAGPGRDRLRGGRGPGPDRATRPGGPGAQAGRRQPRPSRAATADIPAGYLRLYRQAGARYRAALVGAGRHRQGRVRPRPGPAARGALGQELGRGLRADADRLCVGRAGNAWARYGHDSTATAAAPTTRLMPSRPPPATWSTTAPATTWTGRCTPTTTPGPTWPGSSSWPAATPPEGVGGGERPHRPAPGPRAGLDQAPGRGLLRASAAPSWPAPRPARPCGPPAARCPAAAPDRRRLPGTTSLPPTSPWPGRRAVAAGTCPPPAPTHAEGGEPMPASRLADAARPPGCSVGQDRHPLGQRGPPAHRRTLGGHRRFDPELIDALVQALTYRP